VGPRAGLDAGVRRKILCPCRGLNPDRSARSQTLYYLSYRGSNEVYSLFLTMDALYSCAEEGKPLLAVDNLDRKNYLTLYIVEPA
jgi:hypothetical protein